MPPLPVRPGRRSRAGKLIDYAICPYQRGQGGIPLDESPLLSGGWSDYIELLPGAIVHRIPPQIQPSVAVLLEPLSIGAKAVRVADVRPDDTVVILGPGPIGLFAMVAAHGAGRRKIVLAGRPGDEQRLALGRELGAHEILELDETLAIFRQRSDTFRIAVVLADGGSLGAWARPRGDYLRAGAAHKEALILAVQIGALIEIGNALSLIGLVASG